jgi:hypothetical protein
LQPQPWATPAALLARHIGRSRLLPRTVLCQPTQQRVVIGSVSGITFHQDHRLVSHADPLTSGQMHPEFDSRQRVKEWHYLQARVPAAQTPGQRSPRIRDPLSCHLPVRPDKCADLGKQASSRSRRCSSTQLRPVQVGSSQTGATHLLPLDWSKSSTGQVTGPSAHSTGSGWRSATSFSAGGLRAARPDQGGIPLMSGRPVWSVSIVSSGVPAASPARDRSRHRYTSIASENHHSREVRHLPRLRSF